MGSETILYALVKDGNRPPLTRHTVGFPKSLSGKEPRELGRTRFLTLQASDQGFMLTRYDKDREFSGDTWHPSGEEAKEQADFEFGEDLSPWREIPPVTQDRLSYIFQQTESVVMENAADRKKVSYTPKTVRARIFWKKGGRPRGNFPPPNERLITVVRFPGQPASVSNAWSLVVELSQAHQENGAWVAPVHFAFEGAPEWLLVHGTAFELMDGMEVILTGEIL